ncbi:TBC1 domain family member 15 [Camellia lanceoleosa]|uniref:TBC1 domain family member 15 n=1 Tax=Camellia lanceoleosa TaxID=1840588 RepID=A0ACC0G6Q4_9ERIC|nr:TBC1 domain family member 15 [Camellia lanceoleosa]
MLGEVRGHSSRCMASSLVRTGFVRGSMTQGNGCYQHRHAKNLSGTSIKSISTEQAKRFTKFRERKGLIDEDVVRTDRSLSFYDGDDNPNVNLLRDIFRHTRFTTLTLVLYVLIVVNNYYFRWQLFIDFR